MGERGVVEVEGSGVVGRDDDSKGVGRGSGEVLQNTGMTKQDRF